MFLRKCLLVTGLMMACGLGAFAQEPQSQTSAQERTIQRDKVERLEKNRERMGRRQGLRGRMSRHGGAGHMMRELNLTEEQRQQGRATMQRRLEGTKSQREELFKLREKRRAGTFTADDEARAKTLRQEMRASMDGVREEMAGLLTAEQRTKLEELKTARKARREQRLKECQERLNNKPQ